MKPRLYNLPIEPLDMRYSIQWQEWFSQGLADNFDVVTVLGDPVRSTIKHGAFLDAYSTHKWKFTQLARLVDLIEQNPGPAVVFLHDAWFPGIEALGYIRELAPAGALKIAGYLHAGAYDPSDLLGRARMKWSAGCEASWLAMLDVVFVGTKYHAGLLLDRECQAKAISDRGTAQIHVVGIPVEVPSRPVQQKEPWVVFPHRLTVDKHPELFDYLALRVGNARPETRFVRTQDLKLPKDQYYELLSRAAVTISFADHENFGISMIEAALLGSTPIAPKRLAYRETLDPKWLYDDVDQAIDMTIKALDACQPHENKALAFYSPENVTARVSALLSTLV